ncbi:MAG: hypothetical protein ACLPUO_07520 [Streptosporangiaceae bacterium]
MRHLLLRHRGLTARLALATAAATAVTAAAVPALAAAPAAQRAPSHRTAVIAGWVLLINGDQLVSRSVPGGGQATQIVPAPGGGSILTLRLGGLAENIPAYAMPYLGRGLDPSLFSLGALRRAESGGRLPVRITFAGRRHALPGVTITRSGPGTAEGYLTASSARIFGAALARQFRADHARARYGGQGLFAGGVSISLAGAPAFSAPARPDFPMHPLTVTGTNLQGKPDEGDTVFLLNADDWRTFGDPIEVFSAFYHGTAKYSVPAGHYWAIGDFVNFNRHSASERMVVLPQFTVRGNRTTVHLAERSATSQFTVATPRRSLLQGTGFTLVRGGLHHTSASFGTFDFGLKFWVNPTTTKPGVGTLQTYSSAQLTSPRKAAGAPYAYNLNFTGPAGIIPSQHWAVSPASLATVSERYYQDVRTTGSWYTFGGTLAQLVAGSFSILLPVRLPGLQTQYMTGGIWYGGYSEFSYSGAGGQSDNYRQLQPGQQLTQNWNKYPLHPQPDAILPLPGAAQDELANFPSAVRVGNTLSLYTTPFSDNQLGHVGSGFYAGSAHVTGSYAIYQDGARIAHGNAVNGIPGVRLSSKPSVVRFDLTAGRWSSWYPLSPKSTTVWTWRSAPEPHAVVPSGWYCGFTPSGNLLRRCAVQPMLTLSYDVHGLALNGVAPGGRQVIGVSVGHLQASAGAPVNGASAQVSYDGGRFWQPASVARAGSGHFTIAFTPPPGVDVTLRFSAADSGGGSITETILRAYSVGL